MKKNKAADTKEIPLYKLNAECMVCVKQKEHGGECEGKTGLAQFCLVFKRRR